MVRNQILLVARIILPLFLVLLALFSLANFYRPETIPRQSNDLQPFYNMRNNFRLAPDYHLATCQIEKVASTMLTSLFCYLYDTDNYIKANRSIGTEAWDHRFCENRNEVFKLDDLKLRMGRDYTMIVLIRDPLERFISGYTDKCINEMHSCLGCFKDMRCLVNRIYKDLNYLQKNNMDIEYNYIYTHFGPQTWYCSLNNISDKVKYIKYGSHGQAQLDMIEDMASIMEAREVPKYKIEHISNELKNMTSFHATHGSNDSERVKEAILEDEYLNMMIHKIYAYDFKLYEFLGFIKNTP